MVTREQAKAFSDVVDKVTDVATSVVSSARSLAVDFDTLTAKYLKQLYALEDTVESLVDDNEPSAPVEGNSREVMEHFIRTQWNTPEFILTGMSLDQIKSLYEAAINGARNKNSTWSGATDDVKDKNSDNTQPFGL